MVCDESRNLLQRRLSLVSLLRLTVIPEILAFRSSDQVGYCNGLSIIANIPGLTVVSYCIMPHTYIPQNDTGNI